MKHSLNFAAITLVCASPLAHAADTVGQIAANHTFGVFDSAETAELYDLEGSVIFLEWFAWWCPFCASAAAAIEEELLPVLEASNGSNTHGVPVQHVAINLQSGSSAQTQSFIETYSLGIVWEDTSRTVLREFGGGVGQPYFAIINGVAGSPSHEQWEVIYLRNGYLTTNQPIEDFLQAINSVEPPDGGPQSLWDTFESAAGAKDTSQFGETGIGWIDDTAFPFIYSFSFAATLPGDGWLYIWPESAGLNGWFAFEFGTRSWLWMHNNYGGWYYRFPGQPDATTGWQQLPDFQ